MPRPVEVQPAIAERPRLQAGAVGHCDDHDTARRQQARRVPDGFARLGQMLERMPEHDCRPLAIHHLDRLVAKVSSRSRALEPGGRATPPGQGVDQRTVAGADVQHGPWRGDRVQPRGQAASRAAQQLVAEDTEPPARLWPIPRAVGVTQFLVGGPGIARRRAAPRTADQAAPTDSLVSERSPAPDTRPRHRILADEQTATMSRAASRPSSRRWKSSGAIAAARGSSAWR